MSQLTLYTALLFFIGLSQEFYVPPDTTINLATTPSPIIRIAFGSCYDELINNRSPEPPHIFRHINEYNSSNPLDLWLWLGDFAYADQRVIRATIAERLYHYSMLHLIPFASKVFRALTGYHHQVHDAEYR
jgi:hypothetical protein